MGFKSFAAGVLLLLAGAGWAGALWAQPRLALLGALPVLLGLALAWPRRGPVVAAPPEPAPRVDAKALMLSQALLEHLPAAAWTLDGERLQPLTARARRLLAPGGARDAAALQARLLERARDQQSGLLLIETERGSERWGLALQALALDGKELGLLLLLPLETELEAESLRAWRQLVQVLTHEIMNSLTPISSLSRSALELLDEASGVDKDDLRLALDAVARRADSLARFVADYRRVSDWPAPQMAPVDLQALFQRLEAAAAPAWAARGGAARFELDSPRLLLQADAGQLEQALLNLIRNAEQATCGTPTPRLWVRAELSRGGRLRITVRDNGPGVPPGLEQQIFLPFFSAREAAQGGGTGIGLSVVRQLVHGMGGRVRHARPLEGGAAFILSF